MPSSSAGTRSREKLPVVAFANRLPVRRVRNTWRLAAGGLVTALRPAMEVNGGSWIGWDGGAEVPSSVEGLDIELRSVPLARRDIDAYYHGFSNGTLWPLAPRAGGAAHVRARLVGCLPRGERAVRRCRPTRGRRLPVGARLPSPPASEPASTARGLGPDRVLPPCPVPAHRGVQPAAVADAGARRHARCGRRVVPHGRLP